MDTEKALSGTRLSKNLVFNLQKCLNSRMSKSTGKDLSSEFIAMAVQFVRRCSTFRIVTNGVVVYEVMLRSEGMALLRTILDKLSAINKSFENNVEVSMEWLYENTDIGGSF